jgi:glutathione synthase/RimK-type ligase-like ATP-grasp enzyme
VVLKVGAAGRVSGHVDRPKGTVDLDRVGALYLRPVETERACGSGSPDDPVYLRAVATDAAMITWADLASTVVANRPAAMAANNSKPYQLALIAACGFNVPDTLVTTDAAAVRRFHRRHDNIIYKSTSGVRSIVSRLETTRSDALEDVANCPTQFQEYVPGTDMRVHVVADAVLATEIRSAADDYRYASRSGADVAMAPAVLPGNVAAACRAMVHGMGLSVAGIDLRYTPDGKWYCFEVNPSPGFTFFEAATGQPIAATVADLLLRHDHAAGSAAPRALAPKTR